MQRTTIVIVIFLLIFSAYLSIENAEDKNRKKLAKQERYENFEYLYKIKSGSQRFRCMGSL